MGWWDGEMVGYAVLGGKGPSVLSTDGFTLVALYCGCCHF